MQSFLMLKKSSVCEICIYLHVFTPLSQFLYLIGDEHVTGYKELA